MDDLAQLFSSRVGLLLSHEEDRRVVQAAALKNGLQPVDLAGLLGATELPGSSGPQPQAPVSTAISATMQALECVVTDDQWAASGSLSLAPDDVPLVLVVRDAGQPVEPAWVLHRPLQEATVAAHLQQAAYASRIFATRHNRMLEDLHRTSRVFDSVVNGITIADAGAPDLPLIYVNPAFERMTGYTSAEVCGRNCRFLQGDDTDQPDLTRIRKAIREQREVRVLLKNYRKDGVPFWNDFSLSPILDLDGYLTHFVGIQNDVTAQVESSQRLDHLATHDALTGLANRPLLMDRLQQALLRAGRSGGSVGVLFFDLDNFKHVNDALGHDAGDRLLQVVAERLRGETRANEVVARLGGDEFIVVLEDFSDERRPHEVMQRLTSRVNHPVEILGQQLCPSASVGMALFPHHGDDPECLLRVADLNMYAAKHSARLASQSGA